MNSKYVIFSVIISFIFVSCNNNNSAPIPADLSGFAIADHPGGKLQKAVSVDGNGQIKEEGELLDGLKTGAWITYFPEEGRVKSVTNYINGKKNGLHLVFNPRGYVEKQCFYTEDQLNGPYMTFKSSTRKKVQGYYKMGILNGKYNEYNDRNGKLLKEMTYTNGKLDGQFKQYNDEGELIIEYQYKDGTKISGGIVTSSESGN